MRPDEELRSFPYDATVAGIEHHYRITENEESFGIDRTALSLQRLKTRVTAGSKSRANPLEKNCWKAFVTILHPIIADEKGGIMPWYNGDYPPSYKNQPPKLREKAVEIANEILKESGDEGIAIATGLKRAREYFKEHPEEADAAD
jgi:hypothetical protein